MRCKEKNFTVRRASGVAFACACSLYINKKNKTLLESPSKLPGPLCACACSLYINKKKISVAKLQHLWRFGDWVRGAPAWLLCVSAWVGDEVRGALPGLLCVSACKLNFSLVYWDERPSDPGSLLCVSACACGLNINNKNKTPTILDCRGRKVWIIKRYLKRLSHFCIFYNSHYPI